MKKTNYIVEDMFRDLNPDDFTMEDNDEQSVCLSERRDKTNFYRMGMKVVFIYRNNDISYVKKVVETVNDFFETNRQAIESYSDFVVGFCDYVKDEYVKEDITNRLKKTEEEFGLILDTKIAEKYHFYIRCEFNFGKSGRCFDRLMKFFMIMDKKYHIDGEGVDVDSVYYYDGMSVYKVKEQLPYIENKYVGVKCYTDEEIEKMGQENSTYDYIYVFSHFGSIESVIGSYDTSGRMICGKVSFYITYIEPKVETHIYDANYNDRFGALNFKLDYYSKIKLNDDFIAVYKFDKKQNRTVYNALGMDGELLSKKWHLMVRSEYPVAGVIKDTETHYIIFSSDDAVEEVYSMFSGEQCKVNKARNSDTVVIKDSRTNSIHTLRWK